MATVPAFSLSSFNSPRPPSTHAPPAFNPPQFRFQGIKFRSQFQNNPSFSRFSLASKLNNHGILRPMTVRAAADEAGIATSEEEASPAAAAAAAVSDQTVSVAVSPSDGLTMYFQAEGTMPDSAIPAVTRALEGMEGISDLKVQVDEGIASVQLTKQTTVQATGVASNLVETIQGSGFKLHTLNLSFQDEEDFP
ncbi:Heavy metal transport/detoxification superfamily protein [Striga hermonthica]|uniref:Heavy metal transport/detoxification superfamily protein n=1 Tax=Striga hermonthica TaxID=68872 RepID=A0A9N7N2H5_STRHE|nr:Heavy metal transport/detoxification superfamily protein [Striga hermonthica]